VVLFSALGTCMPLRVTVVLIISMIQLMPGQFALM